MLYARLKRAGDELSLVDPSEGQHVSGGDGGDLNNCCGGAGDEFSEGGVRSISRVSISCSLKCQDSESYLG
jgi:hypothetical protein